MTKNTQIAGITYLLITDAQGEHVQRLHADELVELYDPKKRAALARGETITEPSVLGGTYTVRDMVAACRG